MLPHERHAIIAAYAIIMEKASTCAFLALEENIDLIKVLGDCLNLFE